MTREAFRSKYADVFKGDEQWQALEVTDSETYAWPPTSTYVQNPPYFQGMGTEPGVIADIAGRASWRCSATRSPPTTSRRRARSSRQRRPAVSDRAADRAEGLQLLRPRRGNHEVMMRGTFANIRIRNEMLDGVEGGYTLGPDGEQTSIYDAAMAWKA